MILWCCPLFSFNFSRSQLLVHADVLTHNALLPPFFWVPAITVFFVPGLPWIDSFFVVMDRYALPPLPYLFQRLNVQYLPGANLAKWPPYLKIVCFVMFLSRRCILDADRGKTNSSFAFAISEGNFEKGH